MGLTSEYFEITCPMCQQKVKMFRNEQIEEHTVPAPPGQTPVLCGASNEFAAPVWVRR